MIPPSPMQLTLFGSALYGELYFGLCRALAAPWLDPGWLIRAHQAPRAPSPPAAEVRPNGTEGGPTAPRSPAPGRGQVIEVPEGRWRSRRVPSAGSAADR
jgi:hypothetical protein